MAKEIDLGAYSAYAIAVEHGYEGTEAEFAAQLMNSAANGALAQDGAERAEAAAAEAAETLDSIPEDYTELVGEVNILSEEVDILNQGGLNLNREFIGQQVNTWLDEHPEATTTVQDYSIEEQKIHRDFLMKIKNDEILIAKTVADILELKPTLNTLVQSCGYYECNDGGACLYVVIPAKEYAYDIYCNGNALRPLFMGDTICPKQFGTVNNGVDGDNAGLQACFDYARDYNIPVIDGRNMLYTTDSSTPTYHDHYGVVVHQPVTLRNYRGQVADNIGNLTSIIDMLQVANDFREYRIENCEFNGKYGIVPQSTTGMEDGGRHCICFYGEASRFPKEYIAMGNITITNCRFIKPDSYGIFISPADCIYTVENCTFDTNGACVLSYATTMIARNCQATISDSYKTMVPNFLHDEMEMGTSGYQGTKKKSFYVENCHLLAGSCLLKTHNPPQGALSYGQIHVVNCSTATRLVEMYQTYEDKETTVDLIRLVGNHGSAGAINIRGLVIDKIIIDNLDNYRITLASAINDVEIHNFVFTATSSIRVANEIQNMRLNNCGARGSLDSYHKGLTNADAASAGKIVNLYVDDFEWVDSTRTFDVGAENIIMNNVHLYGSEKTYFDFFYNNAVDGCKKFIVKNSVFELPTTSGRYLLANKNASTGNAIIMNCAYTSKLGMSLNGMTEKDINLANLADDEATA